MIMTAEGLTRRLRPLLGIMKVGNLVNFLGVIDLESDTAVLCTVPLFKRSCRHPKKFGFEDSGGRIY